MGKWWLLSLPFLEFFLSSRSRKSRRKRRRSRRGSPSRSRKRRRSRSPTRKIPSKSRALSDLPANGKLNQDGPGDRTLPVPPENADATNQNQNSAENQGNFPGQDTNSNFGGQGTHLYKIFVIF